MALADMSLDELEDEIGTLASHIYAGTCRWLELVAELDRRGGFAACSVAEWLAWRCALSPRAAREHVRVARRLGELPLIHEAFAHGELSYAKVRALTRVAELESEGELLELARHMTASQLERAVRAYRHVTAKEAEDFHALAYAGYTWEPDGSLIVRARLAPEDGALFVRALEASRDRLREREWSEERGSAEPRRPTSAEAFVALAEMALVAGAADRSGGERYQVVVHVDADEGAGVLDDGPALAPETAERLACDASIVEIVERNGEPLSVGRRRARSRPRSGGHCKRATAAAASLGATTGGFCTRTTSATGRKAARRSSRISSCSAAATTASCTRRATRSFRSRTASSSSTIPGAARSPTSRVRRPAMRSAFWKATAASGSTRGPARAATAIGWTSGSRSTRFCH
jgi:hypothetical protein